jgi:hypothetical protein
VGRKELKCNDAGERREEMLNQGHGKRKGECGGMIRGRDEIKFQIRAS